MISVAAAKQIVIEHVPSPEARPVLVKDAAGLTLADDVYATQDIPPFPQSSMDGYAFAFNDWQTNKHLKITGESAAGTDQLPALDDKSAMRIFTGAPLPAGADTVVMQEKTNLLNDELIIADEALQRGVNVRPKGSEIHSGSLALQKETVLTPAAIGFLAGIGISEVNAYPSPDITIVITGNELQQPGKPLQYGQVYESNSFALQAALKQLQIDRVRISYAKDDPEVVTDALRKGLEESDIVLFTGGISAGDYDFVLAATNACGVQQLFHKVKQRPGKPLYFGKKDNKLVFGLPGNPSSVLSCFYQYVVPALEIFLRRKHLIQTIRCPLAKTFQKNTGLTHFLKGKYDGKTATVLNAQESYRLSSFAVANCLIQIDEAVTSLDEGALVDIYLLPV